MKSPLSLPHLRSMKKYGMLSPRVKSVDDTLKELALVCKKIGITRISDITTMDKLYIPNYSAILPGTEDSIWVYSGKGASKSHAKASALMEAVERYCSLSNTSSRIYIQGTYSELSKTYHKVLHPSEVVEPVDAGYTEKKTIMDFMVGFDLIMNEKVLVPAQLVLSKYSPKSPSVGAFLYSHTNGLASGNVLEEAICHALCEVIERDAASIADLSASSIPYSILEKVINSLKESHRYSTNQILENEFVDDPSIFPEVSISEIAEESEPIKFLNNSFAQAGLSLLIKDITQEDINIPTFVASSIEWITSDYGYFAKGYGTHLDARIALIRAITELSQTRAANIQGARDDFKKIQYKENDEIYRRKWPFMQPSSSPEKNNSKAIMFSKITTYIKEDILEDIKLILTQLKKAGLKRAIIVNLTNPDIGIPVVRAIVPGLETFEVAKLFTNTNLIMGRRAKAHYQKILHS
jgi:ribosomal protein S12 methylthiotransferase accessory factor YcaO